MLIMYSSVGLVQLSVCFVDSVWHVLCMQQCQLERAVDAARILSSQCCSCPIVAMTAAVCGQHVALAHHAMCEACVQTLWQLAARVGLPHLCRSSRMQPSGFLLASAPVTGSHFHTCAGNSSFSSITKSGRVHI
jgi:hypothetical protein